MKLRIESDSLHVTLEGWEHVWALHGSLSIPLDTITAVEARHAADKPPDYWKGLRVPGTFLPGVIKAGTYYASVGREFWYYTRGKPFLVLHLNDGSYRRVVLGIDDTEVWAQRIRAALSAR